VVTGDWLRIILPKKHPRNDFDFGKTDESQHRQLVRLLPVRWVLAKKDKVEFIM
jgi:hypothetical protein